MAPDSTGYEWLRDGGVEPVNWGTTGDEWLHHLGEQLARNPRGLRVAGMRSDATTQPFIEVTAVATDGTAVDARLLIVPTDDGLIVMFGGHEDEADESACDAWAAAYKSATRDLGSGDQEFDWSAIVGSPAERIGGTESALSAPVSIGPFTLASVGHHLQEASSQIGHPSLSSWTIGTSWPILVRGRHRGYDWNSAGRTAAHELQLLCALLTVSNDHACFVVREGLAPADWGVRQVPEMLAWQNIRPASSEQGREPNPWSPPTWSSGAWSQLVTHSWLAAAVTSYHEGVQSALAHPSLALVAYIAAIEAVSNRLLISSRCIECGTQRYVKARFAATLRLVLADDRATSLAKAYSPRSATVHQGVLHGGELQRGHLGHTWVRVDPVIAFEWGMVYQMGRAAQALLARALRDDLPEKTDFDPARDPWRAVDRTCIA